MELKTTRDGDNRYRVTAECGRTVGFITKWYETHAVNKTGVPRFRANPIGSPSRDDCESMSSAIKYMEAFA